MRRLQVAVVVLLLGAFLTVTTAARAGRGLTQVSSNWSGYVAKALAGQAPLEFTDATGSWTVKRIFCGGQAGTSAAFWVGIGGARPTSKGLEQIGSSAECGPSGTARYRAWIEVIPAPARYLPLTIRPGDRLTAAVTVSGRVVTFSLADRTRRKRYSSHLTVGHPLDTTSAEWIAEAPSLCLARDVCDVVPLANFGRVRFSGLAMIAGSHPGTLTDPAWLVTPVLLATGRGAAEAAPAARRPGAAPGTIDPAGRSFTVSYHPRLAVPAAPAPHADAPLPSWVH